jgi:hypothetical protein
MGEEKLDNAVYLIRGLYDLADMARAKHDRATERWAGDLAKKLRGRFDGEWWNQPSIQYADSLDDPGNHQVQQQHWIGVTPMEAELTVSGRPVAGLAPPEHAAAALAERENDCYSGTAPFSQGLFHTGCEGGPTGAGEKTVFSLTTAIQAVADGNYGRVGATEQRRYTSANADAMFAEAATGGQPDEQPGALPEILPSPDFDPKGDADKNLDRCWTCRGMFMQAWGHYGTAWPVIHQQLGVSPSLGTGRLEIVPQLPAGQTRVQGRAIRLGGGEADVRAERHGRRYTTTVTVSGADVRNLRVGTTLPPGDDVAQVRLDGNRVRKPTVRETHRGVEVTVRVPVRGRHAVTVTSG